MSSDSRNLQQRSALVSDFKDLGEVPAIIYNIIFSKTIITGEDYNIYFLRDNHQAKTRFSIPTN